MHSYWASSSRHDSCVCSSTRACAPCPPATCSAFIHDPCWQLAPEPQQLAEEVEATLVEVATEFREKREQHIDEAARRGLLPRGASSTTRVVTSRPLTVLERADLTGASGETARAAVGQLLLEAVDPAKVTLSLLLQDPDPHQVLPTLLTSHLLNNKRCQVILTQNRRFKQI